MTLTSTLKVTGLLFVAALVVLWGRFATGAQAQGQQQPNIVLVTTDDQPLTSFQKRWMPNVFKQLAGPGTVFTDAVANAPLCAPSRATLLTGQYPHNTGVLTNDNSYKKLDDRHNVLPVWLQRAGYRTGHFGKWLHDYEAVRGNDPAPGWDRWVTLGDKRRYYDYEVSVNGGSVRKGHKPADHVTAVTSRAASHFVAKNVRSNRPLFTQVDYFAPHESGSNADARCAGAPEPLKRDVGAAKGTKAPRGPSFNEKDVSDKPYYEQLRKLSKQDVKDLDRRYRCVAESVLGVDRGIGNLVDRFREAGELRNTVFIFMTDNGVSLGEHRVSDGKSRPWEESIRAPLVIRMPSSVNGAVDVVSAQVAGIDIAPTLLDLAGAEPCDDAGCRALDGRSLLAPATGDASAFDDRGVLVELAEKPVDAKRTWACSFTALRTSDQILSEATRIPDPDTKVCEDGLAYEYYDLADDPHELDNRVGSDGVIDPDEGSPRILERAARLDALRNCSGVAGRDPETPGGYCE
jgi:arylsulfatase A-like enzyme